jgi:hypothetical protein
MSASSEDEAVVVVADKTVDTPPTPSSLRSKKNASSSLAAGDTGPNNLNEAKTASIMVNSDFFFTVTGKNVTGYRLPVTGYR